MPTTTYRPAGIQLNGDGGPGELGARRDCLLVMRGITRRYGARTVLRDADLQLGRGESLLVTGPNGCGKTTLLRVAAGVITPHGGSLSLFGLDPQERRRDCQRRIGFLPAGDRAVYARLTVRQNLDFWASIAFVPRRERRAVAERALRRFELEEMADRRTDRLSMGQRQRARLAMTFLHQPELVLLDEPDSSLDEDGLHLLRTAVGETLERGGSVLWCAPTGSRKTLPCDRAYVLADGSLEPA